MSRRSILIIVIALAAVLLGATLGYRQLVRFRADRTYASAAMPPEETEGEKPADGEKPVQNTPEPAPEGSEQKQENGDEAVPKETDKDLAEPSGPDADSADTAEPEETLPEEELSPAPDFTVETMKGETDRLSDHLGKPVIVNFWATWCYWCDQEFPEFQEAYKEYGDRIDFMMVDLTDGQRETKADVSAYLLKTGYTFPVYLDTERSAALAYETYSIPVTVAVDAEGNLKFVWRGALAEGGLQQLIGELLGE